MILTGLLLNLLVAVGTLMVLWLVYLWKRNPAVVDLGWAVGLTLMGLTHHLMTGRISLGNILVSLLVLLWGIRLGGYLFWTRLRLGKKDARYESLQKKQTIPAPVFFLMHYLIQAGFQTVVGFVFIFTSQSEMTLSMYDVVGLIVWGAGFCGTILADGQLHRFRADPTNQGKVCQNGLWNYSRHPNYFFEILLWFGFSLLAVSAPLGWLGFLSPTVLLLTMRFITGPISERQSLRSKPDAYRHYQDTTPMIVPWFKTRLR
jgi:steroid 5-alpha reductase family enzyme